MTRCLLTRKLRQIVTAALAAQVLAPSLAAQDLGPSVSGDARMGIVYERPPAWAKPQNGLRMTSRARIKFQFTGETDGGVRFGGELRLDESRENRPTGHVTFGE